MAKVIRKVLGALFIITALILTQIPMPEAFAANTVEDFQMDEDVLVEYTGIATAVSVPDTVKTIGSEAFSKNTDVGSVNVGKNTEEIKSSAFAGCKYLTSVTIPDNVVSIGDYVFSGCDYLSKVKIGEGVEEIGTGVFAGCHFLSTIEIDSNNPNFVLDKGALYDAKKENLIAYLNGYNADTYNMPNSVKDINAYSFWGNDTLEYIDLSNYLYEIPGYAFSNCTSLKNITLPYSVNTIDAKAFENCVSLTDVVIPPSVSYIDPTAFDGCRKLNIIADKGTVGYTFYQEYLARSAAQQAEEEEVLIVPGTSHEAKVEDGVVSNDAHGQINAINDPSNVDYMPSSDPLMTQDDPSVKAKTLVVGGNAILFIDSSQAVVYGGNQNNADQNKLPAESTVSVEGNYASNNTEIVKEQDKTTVSFSQQASSYNDNKTATAVLYDQTKGGYLPKYAVLDEKIAAQGFYADQSITTYNVPDSVNAIGEFAFARSGLISIDIPQSVTTIEYGAFYHCDSLSNVLIPSSVKEIEAYAFANTPFLQNFMNTSQSPYLVVGDDILLAYKGTEEVVVLPEGIKQIAPNCFENHTEILSITLPTSLEIIGEDAFNGCSNLRTVSGGTNVKEIRDRAFMNCPLENYTFPAGIEKVGLRAIDFSGTNKTDDTKVVAFSSRELPVISVGKESERLSNTNYREDALYDVDIVIVPNDCDDYDDSVLDSSLPGFSGLIVTLDDNGTVKVKACLAASPEALNALTKTFTFNGITYMVPEEDYQLSANRKKGVASRNVDVSYNGEQNNSVTAVFTGEEVVGTLAIDANAVAKERITTAYKELFGSDVPKMEGYSIELTDVTGYIPITKFGKSELTISMPIPDGVDGNRYRVVCLDEDGQLEEVDSITKDEIITFTTTHLSDYAIYATGDNAVSLSLENGKLVKNYKKDESPDTGDNSLPVNYVFALGISLMGIALLLYHKKKI